MVISKKGTSFIVIECQKSSWLVSLWYVRCQLSWASVGQTHGWMLMNRDVTRMTRKTSMAPVEITPTFWEHFTHRWDVPHAHELAYTHTGRYTPMQQYRGGKRQTSRHRQAYKHSSVSPNQHYTLSCYLAFFLSLSFTFTYKHTVTQVG